MAEAISVDKRLEAMEKRLRELEDVRAVEELFRKWNYACTGGFNGLQAGRMEALDVLTEDATIEIQGIHEPGKGPQGWKQCEEYWSYWYGDAGPLPFVYQTAFDDHVEVSGDTATHYCNFLLVARLRGAAPVFGVCRRVNFAVLTPKGWRIRKTTGEQMLVTPLSELKSGIFNPEVPQEPRTAKYMKPYDETAKPGPWPYRRGDTGK